MSTRQEDPRAANAADAGPEKGPKKGPEKGPEEGSAQDPADAADRRTGTAAKVRAWLTDRIPGDWFAVPPDIQVDREEITIIGTLAAPAADPGTAGQTSEQAPDPKQASAQASASEQAPDAEQAAAAVARIRRFREESRNRRIEIAREAEHRFGRKVSWGVICGPVSEMFTTLSVPVMTRLRQSERRVLDTLVDAGVARSRSDALAWCVRLTGENADEWLSRLRDALRHVEEVRDQGPAGALTIPGPLV
jgi:hypothetical protein